MTENEALKILKISPEMKKEIPNLAEVYEVAVKALEENQQYRAIGTVEEFKALKEKETEILLKDGQFLYQQGLVDGYAKAIDEFFNELCKASESVRPVGWTQRYCVVTIDKAMEIAEQLKAGGE